MARCDQRSCDVRSANSLSSGSLIFSRDTDTAPTLRLTNYVLLSQNRATRAFGLALHLQHGRNCNPWPSPHGRLPARATGEAIRRTLHYTSDTGAGIGSSVETGYRIIQRSQGGDHESQQSTLLSNFKQ